jgi:hypothetical protein
MVNYLINRKPSAALCTAYHCALEKIRIDFSSTEKKLWIACQQRRWILPYVDAYLAFRHSSHPIRRKLFVMLALLETQPDYHEFFLPDSHSYIQLPIVLFKSLWSILKIGLGKLVLWII